MRINVFKSGGNAAQGGFVSNGLTLQGPLILSGPHTEPLHAVPKQYVDNAAYDLNADNITSGVLLAARLPAFTGDATVILGSSNIILANTGVTPGSIVKPTVDAKGRVTAGGVIVESDISGINFNKLTVGNPTTLNGYGITDGVTISGNTTIVGDLIQSSNPVDPNHVVTKQYIDAAAGQAGGLSVGDILRKPYTTTPAGFLKCNGGEISKTTYANLYAIIGNTFNTDFSETGNGKPWQQQYNINKVQTADLLGWNIGTSLPSVISHTSIVVTKNRVYALGGYNGSAGVSIVYTAPINSDGTLGTWVAGTSLPVTRLGAQSFVTKNRVYLCGGATTAGATFQSTVYTAPINSDGTLGTWTTTSSLPGVIGYFRILVIKNNVYTFSGWNGSSYLNTIYTTTINDDGTINNWSVYGTTPYSCYLSALAVIKNRVYMIGGYNATANRRDVYYAPINSDGTLGTWVAGIFLPKAVSYTDCVVTNNKIHLLIDADIYSANINSDGSLGTWYKSATMPYNMGDTRIVITSSKIYFISSAVTGNVYNSYVIYADMLGGNNDYSSYYSGAVDTNINYTMPGSGRPWQQQYQINTTQSADITGWVAGTSLPGPLQISSVIVTKNRVYLLGGYNSTTTTSAVYTAPINADGTLGTWTTGTALPAALRGSNIIATKNRVYLCGGFGTNVVYAAPINADGTLGTWVTETSLPANITEAEIFITKNRVYLCGGNNGSTAVTTVYTAPINSDGTIGAWVAGVALPVAIYGAHTVVTKNRVYLMGGALGGGTSYSSYIYTAVINSDGTIGPWTVSGNLPGGIYKGQVIVTTNCVYLLGGQTANNNATSAVYKAPIDTDGVLGAWVTGTSLPGVLYHSQAIVTKNRVYLLGGNIGATVVSTVYTASLLEGINDYSPYYDGTIQPITVDVTTFKLPDYSLLDKEFGEYVTSYIKY